MTNVILDIETATALVEYETSDESVLVYSEYIAANKVTLETVKDHVQALANLAFPKNGKGTDWQPAARKAFCTKIRNGLNYQLGKEPSAKKATENLLTGTGVERFSEMSEDDIVAAVMAELAARLK